MILYFVLKKNIQALQAWILTTLFWKVIFPGELFWEFESGKGL